jgi:hypothetical protein
LGLSDEFEAPTVNGQVAVLAEQISSLSSMQVNLSKPQVLSWVNQWWVKSDMQLKITKADDFLNDCEAFFTSLVTSFKTRAGEVTILWTKVTVLSVGCGGHSPSSSFGSISICIPLIVSRFRSCSASSFYATSSNILAPGKSVAE